MNMNNSTYSNINNQTKTEEIGGLAYILKYASVYIPYTSLSFIGFLIGLCGTYC
jgi:hypothetical protein